MQKPLSAFWNFLLKWACFLGSYVYDQLFHWNNLFIAIKVNITEPSHKSLIKMFILEENFKRHLEAFASELFIYNSQ